MKKTFPKDFLWGVAYSSHQVEGNNKNNDWWEWEQQGKTKEKSGWACDSWNRYPIDHQLVEDLGCGGFRLSLEWSRIEPEKGKFSDEAIEHYRNVLKDLKARGIKRVVTLWHWTLPLWFSHEYGWHKKESVECFAKYCKKVISELGEEIDIFITMNEPTIFLNKGYLVGVFPPGKRCPFSFWRARKNMIKAHKTCYELIKKSHSKLPVGITQYCNSFEFFGVLKKLNCCLKKFEFFYNWGFIDNSLDEHDFIGVDYYATFVFSLKPPFVRRKTTQNRWADIQWGIYSKGMQEVCEQSWARHRKPIYIFENGIADAEDKYRASFIKEHLRVLNRAIKNGVDVKGYFHWSLLDNFEWNKGFNPRFGLCEMDFKTMERKPRKSYYYYQKIIKQNSIEIKTKK